MEAAAGGPAAAVKRAPEQVIVHPLVLLSVVDHYNRVAKDTKKRVVGVLLGESYKGRIDATNSFAGAGGGWRRFVGLRSGLHCGWACSHVVARPARQPARGGHLQARHRRLEQAVVGRSRLRLSPACCSLCLSCLGYWCPKRACQHAQYWMPLLLAQLCAAPGSARQQRQDLPLSPPLLLPLVAPPLLPGCSAV